MIIPVNKKYRLTSNINCWQVEEYDCVRGTGKQAGQKRWNAIYFVTEFGDAVKALHELRIRRIPHETFDLIRDSIERIEEETIKVLEQVVIWHGGGWERLGELIKEKIGTQGQASHNASDSGAVEKT